MPESEEQESKSETKKKSKGVVKGFFGSFVNVKKWVAYDEVSSSMSATAGLYRRFFLTKYSSQIRQETYEEAIARLGLNEEQLALRKRNFLYASVVYFSFTLSLFVYFIYLLVGMHIISAMVDLILVSLSSLLTYREHFWYMQMQKRKLGYNFHDWIAFVLRRN